ncbi:MAG: hypothetical protein IT282_05655 [Bacteroidetes bacterium]|nr:hypothetical protein [Bacteroidota bacterium]
MRSGRLFWGVFFVALGLLVFAEKAGILSAQWGVALGLWPLVLVLWGIALLVGGKVIRLVAAGVAGLVLAYLLFTLFSFATCDADWPRSRAVETHVLVEPADTSVHHASFTLDSGAGTFTIADTSTDLLAANVESNIGMYTLDRFASEGSRSLTMSLEGKHKGWRMGRFVNRVAARLHPAPVWDLEMNIGAAKLTCDLAPFVVERLDINAGASKMQITLGDRAPQTTVRISAGASSIRINVPESAACEVQMETALSSKDLSGFTKMGEGTYRTENFGTAKSTITLDIEAGVSSIHVDRY